VRRIVAQSVASFGRYAREGGPVKTEDDPLDPTPVKGLREINAAMRHLEQAVTDAGGIVLRYGGFYGAANDGLLEPVRKRQFPIVGDGGGFFSWIHLDDAAAATVLALEHDGPAIYNIVDDEPAPVREWLPVLADALGAKPPRRVPVWLARLIAGEGGVMIGTEARGASNAKPSASSAGRCATRAGDRASTRNRSHRRPRRCECLRTLSRLEHDTDAEGVTHPGRRTTHALGDVRQGGRTERIGQSCLVWRRDPRRSDTARRGATTDPWTPAQEFLSSNFERQPPGRRVVLVREGRFRERSPVSGAPVRASGNCARSHRRPRRRSPEAPIIVRRDWMRGPYTLSKPGAAEDVAKRIVERELDQGPSIESQPLE
jgi:hypothetical protein